MNIRKSLGLWLMELACAGYLVFQVFFALSRKGPEGVISLASRYLPFCPDWLVSLLSGLPGWLFTGWWVGSFYAFVILLFGWAYLAGIRDSDNFSRRAIMLGTALFCATLFFFPPGKHHDVFLYIFQGKMVALYRANPYFTPPSAFAHDCFYRYVGWQNFTSAYGPLWHWIEAGLYLLGGANILGQIAVFRFFTLILHLLNTWLIYSIEEHIRPHQAQRAMLLYGWNPLLLVYAVAGCSNDTAMIFLLLVGIWLSLKNWRFLSSLALAGSVLVKMFSVLFLPFYLKTVKNKKEVPFSLLLMALATFLVWLPFYRGPATFARPFWTAGNYHHSFVFLWNYCWQLLSPKNCGLATRFLKFFLSGGFIWMAWKSWKQTRSWDSSLYHAAVLYFFLLVVVLPARATWYITWLMPLAILSLEKRILLVALTFSLTGLLALTVYYLFHSYAPGYQVATMSVEIGPPLVLAVKWK
ncbi:MAG TPA: hypothetical protein PK644_09130, partial [bacterium]|nr:hypothetical protein [bacterium]